MAHADEEAEFDGDFELDSWTLKDIANCGANDIRELCDEALMYLTQLKSTMLPHLKCSGAPRSPADDAREKEEAKALRNYTPRPDEQCMRLETSEDMSDPSVAAEALEQCSRSEHLCRPIKGLLAKSNPDFAARLNCSYP